MTSPPTSAHAAEDDIVISGIGMVTALGNDSAEFMGGFHRGNCGIVELPDCRGAGLRTWIGAPAAWSPKDSALPRKALRGLVRAEQMLLEAANRALLHAGIDGLDVAPTRSGLYFAGDKRTGDLSAMLSGLGKMAGDVHGQLTEDEIGAGMRSALSPLFYVEGLQSLSLYNASRHWGIKGPGSYVHGSGDAGIVSLRSAIRALERREVEVAVVAGASDGTSLWNMARMGSSGLLTTDNQAGERACRPYDRAHSGAVLGEGAVALILQRREDAPTAKATVIGVGLGTDGTRAPKPDPEARGVTEAIKRAVRHGGDPTVLDRVTHVIGHGSGTAAGDSSEARALTTAFSHRSDKVRLSTVKPLAGHLSAAAGLLNIATSIGALEDKRLPQVANLDTSDPNLGSCLDLSGGDLNAGPGLVVTRGVEGQAGAVILDA